jgi:DNA-binding transcriptional LysR family regulator
VDDKDWLILKTIAEEKNITKAASRLFISQPALTYRLKNMEEEFGTQLVSRVPSGVVFTPQGDVLLSYVSEMLLKYDAIKEQIKNMADKVQGALRMGSSAAFAHYSLPKIFKGFTAIYPEVEIALKTGFSHQIIHMLEKQEITIAIVRGEHDWEGDRFLRAEEPVCLVSREKLELDELPGKPHVRYSADTSSQKMVDDWWRKNYNAAPNTTMEVTTMDTARQMVLHGLGWSILPSIGLVRSYGLFVKPLFWEDGTPLIRKTWVLCSNGALELQTVRAFLSYLENGQLTVS